MKRHATRMRHAGWLAAALLAVSISTGYAQGGQDVRIHRVGANSITTPTVSLRVTPNEPASPGAAKRWAQIECQFMTTPEWIDEIEFTFFVLLKSADPRQPFVLLTDKVTYQHVPRSRRPHYSWLYIHPHVLDRIGSVEGVAVEIAIRGQTVATDASSPQHLQQYRQWRQQLTPQSGLLLRPEQTPFLLYAPDLQHMIRRS